MGGAPPRRALPLRLTASRGRSGGSRRSPACRARPAAGRSRPCRRPARPRRTWRSPPRTSAPPARSRSTSPRSPAGPRTSLRSRPCRCPWGKRRFRLAFKSLPCSASARAFAATSSVNVTSPFTTSAIMPIWAPLASMKALRYLTMLAGSSAAKAAAAPSPVASTRLAAAIRPVKRSMNGSSLVGAVGMVAEFRRSGNRIDRPAARRFGCRSYSRGLRRSPPGPALTEARAAAAGGPTRAGLTHW